MRALAVLLLALVLAGCRRPGDSRVYSYQPIFPPAPVSDPHGFRDGLWLRVSNDCKFDSTQPVEKWPDCADKTLIEIGRTVEFSLTRSSAGLKSQPYGLYDGPPTVLQRLTGIGPLPYSYWTVSGIERDPQGKIIAARVNQIGCYEPQDEASMMAAADAESAAAADGSGAAPAAAADTAASTQSSAQAPGMLSGLKSLGGDCKPARKDALVNAAGVYARADSGPANFRWVRDGDH